MILYKSRYGQVKPMTNERRLESRLFDAHDRGYYDDVMILVYKYIEQYPEKNQYDIYDMALDECKQQWQLELIKLDKHG